MIFTRKLQKSSENTRINHFKRKRNDRKKNASNHFGKVLESPSRDLKRRASSKAAQQVAVVVVHPSGARAKAVSSKVAVVFVLPSDVKARVVSGKAAQQAVVVDVLPSDARVKVVSGKAAQQAAVVAPAVLPSDVRASKGPSKVADMVVGRRNDLTAHVEHDKNLVENQRVKNIPRKESRDQNEV